MLKDFKFFFYETSEELRTACWPPWWVNNTVLLLKGPRTTTTMFVCQWVQPGAVDFGGVCVSVGVQPHCAGVYSLFVWVLVCLNQMWKVRVHCVCQCVQPGVAGAYSLC